MTVFSNLGANFASAVVFALLGVGFHPSICRESAVCLWKELLEDQNTALGNLMAGVAIALAIIIAAAIH